MSRPSASAAGPECNKNEWMDEPDLISTPAVEAGLESFWIQEPDLCPQGVKIPSPLLSSEQAPSDSIWERKGHTDLVFSRGDLRPPLGSSSEGITKLPNSKEAKSAGNRYPPACNICFEEHGPLCPYWRYIPPGSTVGSGFSVICHICGHKLGMPDWVCYRCGGKRAGRVIKKWCSICDRRYEHESADCPYDKVQAAKYSWVREEEKKKKYKPLEPSGIPYVPRKPEF